MYVYSIRTEYMHIVIQLFYTVFNEMLHPYYNTSFQTVVSLNYRLQIDQNLYALLLSINCMQWSTSYDSHSNLPVS